MREATKARAAFINGLRMNETRSLRRSTREGQGENERARDALPSTGNVVVDAARRHFSAYQRNCSGFVRAVASELGVPAGLEGNANSQIDAMRAGWENVTRDEAVSRAARGDFVVAGLRSNEHVVARPHGHVVVVVPGELYRDVYPRVWSGSQRGTAGQSQGDRSVGQIWRVDDRDRVQYFAASRGQCPVSEAEVLAQIGGQLGLSLFRPLCERTEMTKNVW
jgi:hypothetical protein